MAKPSRKIGKGKKRAEQLNEELLGYNSEEGTSQLELPIRLDLKGGVHLLELYDIAHPYGSDEELLLDFKGRVDDAIRDYKRINMSRLGYKGSKAADRYRQRIIASKARSDKIMAMNINKRKAEEAHKQLLDRAARTTPPDVQSNVQPSPVETPEDRLKRQCSKAGKASAKARVDRKAAVAAGLIPTPPKKKSKKQTTGQASSTSVPIPMPVLNTADTSPIVNKAQDAINTTIDAVVKEVVNTKNEEIKEAWADGYEKGYKDGENKGWQTANNEMKAFLNRP